MSKWLVKWEESGVPKEGEVKNVHSYVDAVWFAALELVTDATNAKLIGAERLTGD